MAKKIRYSGVLLHPTSLPNIHGIGDLGEAGYKFVDLLADAAVGLWQILPLGPVGYGSSPYAALSAFGGNELLISLSLLSDQGYLPLSDILIHPNFKGGRVDYGRVEEYKMPLLFKAAKVFLAQGERADFNIFCEEKGEWLDDYALYRVLSSYYNDTRWYSVWDPKIRERDVATLAKWHQEKRDEIEEWKVLQFFFYSQWRALKEYANAKGIAIVGDLPIFVSGDSVDVWSNRHFMKIGKDSLPTGIAGVPPDAFSPTGQLWGNPVYDWEVLREENYSWWIKRIERELELTDMLRIDHFRGFEAYWEVPYGDATAEGGKWIKAPGDHFFKTLRNHFGHLPFIAEDLGVITPEVELLRDSNNLPGMKILQFAFNPLGEGRLEVENPYLTHNYVENCAAYTGTHDNDTTRGWYAKLPEETRDIVRRYLSCSDESAPWHMVRSVMASVARYAIIPLQDVLNLSSEARMNTPGTCGEENWSWQLTEEQLNREITTTLINMTAPFGRDGGYKDLLLSDGVEVL
ncbi:MAG: 4-alpha-glucanotransferase [Sphaerochaetaceae bacterium]|jgi:4-alpha-glucanotransferase|nr:4-alpha-glucanotransferase [Sphaerochaetaceae bacterium]